MASGQPVPDRLARTIVEHHAGIVPEHRLSDRRLDADTRGTARDDEEGDPQWSVVARVHGHVWGAPSPPAIPTIAAAGGPRRCGRPGERAAPRGLPRPEPWTSGSGRIGAGS